MEDVVANEKMMFAARLKELRSKKGTPRSVLSELCGMRKKAVKEYEDGSALPSFASLVKLSEHFGVTADYLMGR